MTVAKKLGNSTAKWILVVIATMGITASAVYAYASGLGRLANVEAYVIRDEKRNEAMAKSVAANSRMLVAIVTKMKLEVEGPP